MGAPCIPGSTASCYLQRRHRRSVLTDDGEQDGETEQDFVAVRRLTIGTRIVRKRCCARAFVAPMRARQVTTKHARIRRRRCGAALDRALRSSCRGPRWRVNVHRKRRDTGHVKIVGGTAATIAASTAPERIAPLAPSTRRPWLAAGHSRSAPCVASSPPARPSRAGAHRRARFVRNAVAAGLARRLA